MSNSDKDPDYGILKASFIHTKTGVTFDFKVEIQLKAESMTFPVLSAIAVAVPKGLRPDFVYIEVAGTRSVCDISYCEVFVNQRYNSAVYTESTISHGLSNVKSPVFST